MEQMSIPAVIISIVLFFVLFFGIGFLLNMILRMSWIMAIIFPIIAFMIIDDIRFVDYFLSPGKSFANLWDNIISLHLVDIIILLSGFAGAITAGIVIIALRKRGYRMF
ncbi:YuiB family protein [Bacillus litorisediminis]|uniref:YuiB family protein n=1 Tax=Bacillus litorisediminis TaxID=2922713 RepID=UPI001FAC5F93|nr:YuiB family protein [Bacillus litorisediminis]